MLIYRRCVTYMYAHRPIWLGPRDAYAIRFKLRKIWTLYYSDFFLASFKHMIEVVNLSHFVHWPQMSKI